MRRWKVVLAAMLLASVGGLAPPGAFAQTPRRAGKSVTAERYQIDIHLEPEKGWLAAKAVVTLRAIEPVEAIEFELNPLLEIKEITDVQGRKLEFNRSGRIGSPRLQVRLAKHAEAEDEIVLTWVYEGVPRLGGLDYISKDGILLRDESRWYPAVDLAAFAQNLIRIKVPPSWLAVTSGGASELWTAPSPKPVLWESAQPISSRSIFATPSVRNCGPHVGAQRVSASPPLRFDVVTCFSPAHETGDLAKATYFSQLLQWFTANIGRGPGGIAVVHGFPQQRGAIGYSAPGFLVVSEDVVNYGGDQNYMPEFLPHEIAHQWFPIEVTLERPEDGWLAESLAEYLAWRYLLEKQPEAARVIVARAMRDSLAGTRSDGTLPPLAQGLRMFTLYDWEVTYQALYQRGMLVWRTLETVIGRQRVDTALREYYRRHRGGPGSVADFRKICEEISGRDLKWFFDYYLDGTEIPEVEIRRVPGAAPNEYTGEIVVKNVPPEFTTRVEMRLDTAEGVMEHSVATRGEVTPFTVNVRSAVTRVEADPDLRILRWTAAARLNRAQRERMAEAGDAEEAGRLAKALELATQALNLDPANVAWNALLIRFQLGRLYYRQGLWGKAGEEFEHALRVRALDPGADAFYRAWSHVFLGRIARRQGRTQITRQLAGKALALPAYALGSRVHWPGEEREQSAQEALQALARASIPAKRK